MKLGIVILASGWGERFGSNKLLAPLGDCPVIEHVLRTIHMVACESSVAAATAVRNHVCASYEVDVPLVVTRYEEVVKLAEKYEMNDIVHDLKVQSDTVRLGITSEYAKEWDLCMFIQADQPLLSRQSVQKLIEASVRYSGDVSRLCFERKPGSPVVFPRSMFKELSEITGDRGGGYLLKKMPPEDIHLIEAKHQYELMDIDTREDISAIEDILKQSYN